MKIGVEVADQLHHLEFQFATFRKCSFEISLLSFFTFKTLITFEFTVLRFGKSLEVLHGTLKTLYLAYNICKCSWIISNLFYRHIPNIVLRSLLTLSRIAQGLFLVADHILLVGRIGLLKINYDKWNQLYNRCWLYSVTLNLLRYETLIDVWKNTAVSTCYNFLHFRDIYEIRQFLNGHNPSTIARSVPHGNTSKDVLCTNSQMTVQRLFRRFSQLAFSSAAFCIENKHLTIDSIKNMCDILIPLSNLGNLRLNPGISFTRRYFLNIKRISFLF